MGNRKSKPIGMRLLASVAAFLIISSVVYIFIAGINFYAGAVLASAILGLGVPSVSSGETVMEMIALFFESFFDGLMEVVGGIFDAISSVFS